MVVIAPLAIDLFVILACLVAIAIILLSKQIVGALFRIGESAIGWIPWLGGKAKGELHRIEQRLVSGLSDVADGVQGVMGAFWHAAGNLLSSVGHELVGLAVGLEQVAAHIAGVVRPWVVHTVIGGIQHGLKWLRHELSSVTHTVSRVTKVIEHPVHTKIGGAVRAITRPLAVELAHLERWAHAQVARFDHAIEGVLEPDLLWLRHRAQALERAWQAIRARIGKVEHRVVGLGAVALVGAVLARVGAGWILCRNWRTAGRAVCRMPTHFLDDLLGLLADFVVITNICTVLPWLETGVSDIAEPVVGALTAAGAGLCDAGRPAPEALRVPALHLPTGPAPLALHLP